MVNPISPESGHLRDAFNHHGPHEPTGQKGSDVKVDVVSVIFSAIGVFGWGMLFQEWKTRRSQIKAKERRIVIDAPFLPEQAETIMRVLVELNEAAGKSMEKIVSGREG